MIPLFWMIWEYPHARKPLVGGWATPLKNIKVSWDDDIPNRMESHNPNVPNHRPTRIWDNFWKTIMASANNHQSGPMDLTVNGLQAIDP